MKTIYLNCMIDCLLYHYRRWDVLWKVMVDIDMYLKREGYKCFEDVNDQC